MLRLARTIGAAPTGLAPLDALLLCLVGVSALESNRSNSVLEVQEPCSSRQPDSLCEPRGEALADLLHGAHCVS